MCLFIALRTNGITKSKASNTQAKTLAEKANRLPYRVALYVLYQTYVRYAIVIYEYFVIIAHYLKHI